MSNVINMKEITIGVHNIRSISFVNNTVQIVESCEDLQHLADTVMAQSEQLGIEFNCKKAKNLWSSQRRKKYHNITSN